MRSGLRIVLVALLASAVPFAQARAQAESVIVGVSDTGAIKFSSASSLACDAGVDGAVRYVSASSRLELCTGGSWNAVGSSGVSLSGITVAGADNAIANASWNQTWNWALTVATEDAFTFGETTAATGGSGDQSILKAATLASSTAIPMMVTNLGNGISFRVNDETGDTDTSPFIVDAAGSVGIGTTTPGVGGHLLGITGSVGYNSLIVVRNTATTGISGMELRDDAGNFVGHIGNINSGANYDGTTADLLALMSNDNDIVFITGDTYSMPGAVRMRIKASTGNVGIGTLGTAPEALLEVQGVEATDAVIALDADDGDDAADMWFVKSLAAGNSLSFLNDATTYMNLNATTKLVVTPPASEAVAAAATITANACGTVKQISSTGSVTTNTTDTFTTPTAAYTGCCMDVVNVDTADTITLDSNANFITGLGTDIAVGPGDAVKVCSNGTAWYQGAALSSLAASVTPETIPINDLSDAKTDYVTDHNIFMGSGAGAGILAGGQHNLFIGETAGTVTTTGDRNAAVGQYALEANTTGSLNTAFGFSALALTYNGTMYDGNTAVGARAAQKIMGSQNVAIGNDSMSGSAGAGGSDNVAVGASSMIYATGNGNVAVGHNVLSSNVGDGNTGAGYQALAAGSSTADQSTGFGVRALGSSTNDYNTAVGAYAGYSITTGTSNTVIGRNAGATTLTTGSENILIGSGNTYVADTPANNTSNHLNIGNTIFGDLSTDNVRIGGSGVVSAFSNLEVSGTLALTLPSGTTAQRPGTSVNGMLRYNSQTGKFEGRQAGAWMDIITAGGTAAAPDRSIQFNSGNAFAGSAGLVFDTSGRVVSTYDSVTNGADSVDDASIYLKSANPGIALRDTASATGWQIVAGGSGQLAIGASTETPGSMGFASMQIASNGDVSIGRQTQAGGGKLHVSAVSSTGNSVLEALRLSNEDTDGAGANNIGAALTFSLETTTSNTFAEAARIESVFTDAAAGSKDGDMRFYTMGPDAAGATTTERMRITSAGSLLVGTQTLSGTLLADFEGDVGATNYCDQNGANCFNASDIGMVGGDPGSIFVRKTADESVTSSTTLQDDDQLLFSIGANETWEFTIVVFASSSSTTPDIKVALSGPAGSTGGYSMTAPVTASSTWEDPFQFTYRSFDAASATAIGLISSGIGIPIKGLIINGSTAGSVKVQWAQNTSNGTASTVLTNSYIVARKTGMQPNGATSIDGLSDGKTDYITDYNLFMGSGAGDNIATGGQYNTFTGIAAGIDTTVGDKNTAYGYNALYTNKAKTGNTAIGHNAMRYAHDTATPSDSNNTAVGYEALRGSSTPANNTGTNNTALGVQALYSLTTGGSNMAIGHQTLTATTTGSDNNAQGFRALYQNTVGTYNTAVGSSSLYSNKARSRNTAIGYSAMNKMDDTTTVGDTYNTAVGFQAMKGGATPSANTGINNTALGANALEVLESGGNNVAVGFQAGNSLTSGGTNVLIGYDVDTPAATTSNYLNIGGKIYGDMTSAGSITVSGTGSLILPIGTDAQRPTGAAGMIRVNTDATPNDKLEFYDAEGATWTQLGAGGAGATDINGLTDAFADYTTDDNLILGRVSAAALTTGAQYNLFIGESAGAVSGSSTNATDYNTAVGSQALLSLTTGDTNAALGFQALRNTTVGTNNTAIGTYALYSNVARNYNTAVGVSALYYADSTTTTANSFNTAVGFEALRGSTTAANNTGTENTAVGARSLQGATTGSYNAAFGIMALNANTSGGANTALGAYALTSNKANSRITAVGHAAMYYANDTTSGANANNTAVGYEALRGSTTAANNTGDNNTAIGTSALWANTSGSSNVAVGTVALNANTDGANQVAVGYNALGAVTTGGTQNIGIGYQAGDNITTGDLNIIIGYNIDAASATGNSQLNIGGKITGGLLSGDSVAVTGTASLILPSGTTAQRPTGAIGMVRVNTDATPNDKLEYYDAEGATWTQIGASGATTIDGLTDAFTDYATEHNIIMGRASAAALTAGAANNMFIGELAGATTANSTSATDNNVAVGYTALRDLTTGYGNTALGTSALMANKSKRYSTAVGFEAMKMADDTATAADALNTALGYQALMGSATAANNTGVYNTAVGARSLQGNTSGHSNTTLGLDTLYTNTTGYANTAVGKDALYLNSTGYRNVAVGPGALDSNTDGAEQVAVGLGALHAVTTGGTQNIGIGYQAGDNITTGDLNIIIGYDVDAASATGNSQLNIGGKITGGLLSADSIAVTGTASLILPTGTNAQRPGTPAGGMFRYNTDATPKDVIEYYDAEGAAWVQVPTSVAGGAALSGITAATAANAIASGDHAQAWNWALTTATKDAFTFGEGTAATGGSGDQSVLKAATLAASTAIPLMVTNLGDGISLRVNDETGDTDTTPFVVDAAGNVGIGVSAPSYRVHIANNVNAMASVYFVNANGGAGTYTQYTVGNDSGLVGGIGTGSTGTGAAYNDRLYLENDSSGSPGISFVYNGDLRIYEAGSTNERLRMIAGGNLGIGTASPGALTHINTKDTAGNTVLEALRLSHEDTDSAGANNIGAALTFSLETATDGTFAESARIESVWDDATAASKDGSLRFYTMGPDASGSTTTQQMMIDSTGRVMIGTSTATTGVNLKVAGTGAIMVPTGTDAQRPTGAIGMVRVNTDATPNDKLEFYDAEGATWTQLGAGGAGATDINGLTDAFADYTTDDNLILGRVSAAALTTGAIQNLFIGEGAGATTANSTAATDNNVAVGFDAMRDLTVGTNNTAIGTQAMTTLKARGANTAVGYFAMRYAHDTTTAADTQNTAIGYQALRGDTTPANNTGTNNTAVGAWTMTTNSSGSNNTAIGMDALDRNTVANYNTAVGVATMYENRARSNNTAIGYEALRYTTDTATPSDSGQVAVGFRALRGSTTPANNTGTQNTAVGTNAMFENTAGSYNVALGYSAGDNNKAKSKITAVGFEAMKYADDTTTPADANNTALGYQALRGSTTAANNTGVYNTAIGAQALMAATSGGSNSAVGYLALYKTTTGNNNVAMGRGALFENLSGVSNTALGTYAMLNSVSGAAAGENTAVGYSAMYGSGTPANNTGVQNVAVGVSALASYTSGQQNAALGYQALYTNSTGSGNQAVGTWALYYNTTGIQNAAMGLSAMEKNTTGSLNIAIGYGALYSNKQKSNNVAIGYSAMYYADDAASSANTHNTAIGFQALMGSSTAANNTGTHNTALGSKAMEINTSGANNVAVGSTALDVNTDGANQVGVGYGALGAVTTGGTQNIAIGYQAGDNITTGDLNIIIGYDVDASAVGANNELNIGGALFGTGVNGGTVKIGVGDASPDHVFDVAGNIGLNASSYINFGDTDGTTGYGIRDNSGTVECKNSGGSWAACAAGGGGTPGGSNTQVQFNDSSAFGGDAGFVYDKTNDALTVSGKITLGAVAGLAAPTTSGSTTFDSLSDVSVASPATADMAVWDGTSSWSKASTLNTAILVPDGTAAQRPTAANGMVRYKTDGTVGFEVYEAGAWVAMGAAASDIRLKTDVAKLDSREVLERLSQVQGVSYRLNEDGAGVKRYGVIAQELEKVFPELVDSPADPAQMKSVRYQEFTGLLIEAAKELKDENEDLKTRLASIEEDVDGLKAQTGYGVNKAETSLTVILLTIGLSSFMFLIGGLLRRKS